MSLVQIVRSDSLENLPESEETPRDYNEIWCFTLDYEEEAEVIILNNQSNIPIVDAVELYVPGGVPKRAAVLASSGQDCPFTNLMEETGNRKFRPKKFFVFTVLDMRGYKKKDGEEVPYVKRALLVKSHMMDKFFKRLLLKTQERHGTIQGSKFEVARGKNMNPSPPGCGDMWDFIEIADLEQFEDTEVLTEEQVLGLFVTEPDELQKLANEWRHLADTDTKAKY